MKTIARKTRKLVTTPGLFFRDYFVKKYPLNLSERVPENSPSRNSMRAWDNLEERPIIAADYKVAFPIDFVFTWVDSSDPIFLESYAHYAGKAYAKKEVNEEARFQSLDEIRYAIRSVYEYAPWVRNIYIVTNGQVPKWLDQENSKVKVVPHKEILEEKYLPTFNSHVIESALHRIPGLAEHYVYFNDDMLLTRPVAPEYFFNAGGLGVFFLSSVHTPNAPINVVYDSPTQWGAKNAAKLIYNKLSYFCTGMFAHTFYTQVKSVAEWCEATWPEEFDLMRRNRFRAPSDLLCTGFLFPHVARLTGKGVFSRTRLFYFNVRNPSAAGYYRMLLQKKGSSEIVWSVCPNDRSTNDSFPDFDYKHALINFLEAFYPTPSPAELPKSNEELESNLRTQSDVIALLEREPEPA